MAEYDIETGIVIAPVQKGDDEFKYSDSGGVGGNDDDDENFVAVSKQGEGDVDVIEDVMSQPQITSSLNNKNPFRPSVVDSEMLSYKGKKSYGMAQDVYAFITAAPVCSQPFVFACYVIATKYVVYGTLLSGITFDTFDGSAKPATMVKFFLIPVAISMQADLMAVYECIANFKYSPDAIQVSPHATRLKFILSYTLRFIDGWLSLSANFCTMLRTDAVLDVFMNFAALHFLQGKFLFCFVLFCFFVKR
jgi:hypothetical protein